MLMRPFIIVVFIATAQASIAQQKKVIKSWAAGVTTNLAIPGSTYLALQPCAELRFENRYSIVGGYSFKLIDLDESEQSITNERYGRFLVEGRYRFTKKESKPAFYTSLQLTWSFRKFTKADGHFLYEYDDDSTTYFTKANVSSPVTTASVQLGFNSQGKKKFYMDFFGGMGFRVTNTKFSNIEGKTRSLNLLRKHYDWDAGLEVGKPATYFHITAGLRLFYRIG
jgi:hypothetical protein